MIKRILYLWQNDNGLGSYDLAVTAIGPDLDQIRQQLSERLFRITEHPDHITAIFTGEFLAAVNKMRQLEREGWSL